MKNLIIVIVVLSTTSVYSQRLFMMDRENDTLRIKILNEEYYKFIIYKNDTVLFQKSFQGEKYIDIYAKDYLYIKRLDTINKISAVEFMHKSKFSINTLKFLRDKKDYWHLQPLIDEMIEEYNIMQEDMEQMENTRDQIRHERY